MRVQTPLGVAGSDTLWTDSGGGVYGVPVASARPADTSPRTRRLSVHASWKIGCTFGAPAELTQTFGLPIGSFSTNLTAAAVV